MSDAAIMMDPATNTPFKYTLDDFDTAAPYDYVLDIKDDFLREMAANALEKHAKAVGMKVGFKKALQARQKSRRQTARMTAVEAEPNIVSFQDAELDLEVGGGWSADERGIWRTNGIGGIEWACSHPIYPAERLRNIDTGELKVRLVWSRGIAGRHGSWQGIVTEYNSIANAKDIVKLANLGIAVTSSRAKTLVDYLADVMDSNYDKIPERKSVARLGWNEEGFSPYIGDVVFDGNDAFGRTYAAVRPHGDYEKWKAEARAVRKYSLLARIVLATSFASVLVDPMGCLPFFVHLWGMDSGTGKTVAQMMAASVWAEPTPGGEFFRTFKSTTVGFEVLAGFLRSLPVIIDELQLAKDARGRVIFNVYELASGSGKMRSNIKLGLAATPRWGNCFITSGETPITGEQDGAGALNRVIEVECTAENKIIENGHRTAEVLKTNYGHAGKEFVEILTEQGIMEWAKTRYTALYSTYTKTDATEKQAHSAALITLADELATKWIFRDGAGITVEELSSFLRSRDATSAAQRGYEYICDWVAQNVNKFNEKTETGEVYGRFPSNASESNDAGYVYIIRSAFNGACAEAGVNAKALLSHLRTRGIIQIRGKGYTKSKRIGGIIADCIIMRLQNQDFEDISDENYGFPL